MFLTREKQTCQPQIIYYYIYLLFITLIQLDQHTQCEATTQQFVSAQQKHQHAKLEIAPYNGKTNDDDGSVTVVVSNRLPRQATPTIDKNQVIPTNNSNNIPRPFDLESSIASPDSDFKVKTGDVISDPPNGRCDTMIVPLCNDVGWNRTVKPFKNHFNHSTQDQANEELNKFGGLFNTCKDINLFLCTLFAPQCTVMWPNILKPCRHVCTSVRNQCGQYLTYYNNVSILDPWDCNVFPTPEQDPTCVGDHAKAQTHNHDLPFIPFINNDDPLARCSDTQFDCKHTNISKPHCIETKYRCDGVSDCPGNQDEMNCPLKQETPDHCIDSYFCEGRCLPYFQLCDGIVDCQDGTDEIPSICQKHHPLEVGFDYIKIVMVAASTLTVIIVVVIHLFNKRKLSHIAHSSRESSESIKSGTNMDMNGMISDDYASIKTPENFGSIIISHSNLAQMLPPNSTYQESTYGRFLPGTSTGASSTYGNNYYQRCPTFSTHNDCDIAREDSTYILSSSQEDIPLPRAPPPTPELVYDDTSYVDYDNVEFT